MKRSDQAIDSLSKLFSKTFGKMPSIVEPLPQSGGNRRYFRLRADESHSVIGVEGDDLKENKAFIYLDNCLRAEGINVPEIFAVSEDERCYLQQDLGDVSLFSILNTPEGEAMMEKAVSRLPLIQDAKTIDWNEPSLQRPFSSRGVMADLNYFKYCFLKPCGVDFDEDNLQDDFESLCRATLAAAQHLEGLMYRDCQSRNIMISEGDVWWIDFQGARRGPMVYDIVSMLWQAKASLSDSRRKELLDIYFDSVCRLRPYPKEYREKDVNIFALLRTLQVLGAYGFRGLTEHRAHFITSIPAALANLKALLDKGVADAYPELRKSLAALCGKREEFVAGSGEILQVEVYSFSFKKGYPADYSGNGGGFMFDCRAIHNPGRYEQYKHLTGMDSEVIDFLERERDVEPFLNAAFTLADASVERYLKRGFSHLQIGFGCTGGRHRSVYCAERMARHLHEKFHDRIKVVVRHREQNIEKTL